MGSRKWEVGRCRRPRSREGEAVRVRGTCLADLFYPEAALAETRLVRQEGLDGICRQGQRCYRQPPLSCGDHSEAQPLARPQVALLPKAIAVVLAA